MPYTVYYRMPFLIKLQQFLAIHRKQVSNIFFFLELLTIGLWLVVYLKAFSDFDSLFLLIYEAGLKLGQAAIILYTITLLPGIITRLQWFPKITQPIASIILPFRRHFGILMFLTAFVHQSFTTTLPYYAGYDFQPPNLLPPLALFQIMGLAAWLLLLPLWLTSNDKAQKGLGKWWKIVHRLTYFALLFIFLHVGLQNAKWMYLIGSMVVLEIISWIMYWRRQRAKAKSTVASVTINQQTSQSSSLQQDDELKKTL